MKKMRHKQFSLIELLIVVAVITILMSLLQPALKNAMDQARSIACLQNLRNINLGWRLVVEDQNGRYFFNDLWPVKISNMLGNDNFGEAGSKADVAMLCPKTDPNPGGWAAFGTADKAYSIGSNFQNSSYGINEWVEHRWSYTIYNSGHARSNGFYMKSDSDVSNPSNTPIFTDSIWYGGWPMETDFLPDDLYNGDYRHQAGSLMGRYTIDRHFFGVNNTFIDGSARHVDLYGLWSLEWHQNWDLSAARF